MDHHHHRVRACMTNRPRDPSGSILACIRLAQQRIQGPDHTLRVRPLILLLLLLLRRQVPLDDASCHLCKQSSSHRTRRDMVPVGGSAERRDEVMPTMLTLASPLFTSFFSCTSSLLSIDVSVASFCSRSRVSLREEDKKKGRERETRAHHTKPKRRTLRP